MCRCRAGSRLAGASQPGSDIVQFDDLGGTVVVEYALPLGNGLVQVAHSVQGLGHAVPGTDDGTGLVQVLGNAERDPVVAERRVQLAG